MRLLVLVLVVALPVSLATAHPLPPVESTWSSTKNSSDDNVYHDNPTTLYCGCEYTSHGDSDGSGDVSMPNCGVTPLSRYPPSIPRIEWEHIVPGSLMPARQMSCWESPERFDECSGLSGRKCCEKLPKTKAMMFDRHNLAPSLGQLNQYRGDDRYAELPEHGPEVEKWPGCDGVRHVRPGHHFEPADCTKGDVARVWFYMHDEHGVVIPDDEWEMFEEWADSDPVSPWEVERDARIAAIQGNHNPYVGGVAGDPAGACPWDP